MLPKNLRYQSKIESAMAQSYRTNIAPLNSTTAAAGTNIIINIPTSDNLVLATTESYLKFGLQLTTAAADVFRLDSCGAHGFIQKIRVFSGSNLLEEIDNYGLLAKMLFDIQQSTDATYGRQNQLCGTRSDLVSLTPAAGIIASCLQVNSGEGFNFAGAGVNSTLANNCTAISGPALSRYYCLNLISLLGSLNSQNYFPLFACKSTPIRIEIQLVNGIVNAGMSTTGTTTFSLVDIEYIANFIKLSDAAMEVIWDSIGGRDGQLSFSIPQYANYQYTYVLGIGATQVNFSIPAKFSSLKSIFVMIRDNAGGTGVLGYFPYSTVTANLSNYYFRVGSEIMPTKAPYTYPEMFAELCKAFGSISDLNWHPSIEKTSYETLSSGTALTIVNQGNANSGSFYIGLDLENYVSAPKDTIWCGKNTNTSDIFCVLNYGGSTVTNIRLDAFAMFDAEIVCQNNVCFRQF
jgi:hypothetical protein